ncbi:MAG: 50S ribosomal protein L18 [bacterium]|nr:50S ribosomal protein L18 [bacterium]
MIADRSHKNRAKLRSRSSRPRLSVHRSSKYIYAQVIDDKQGKTLAAARGNDAKVVGEQVAKAALAAKISEVVFDRGSYRYHGQVKNLAEAARAGGLKF